MKKWLIVTAIVLLLAAIGFAAGHVIWGGTHISLAGWQVEARIVLAVATVAIAIFIAALVLVPAKAIELTTLGVTLVGVAGAWWGIWEVKGTLDSQAYSDINENLSKIDALFIDHPEIRFDERQVRSC